MQRLTRHVSVIRMTNHRRDDNNYHHQLKTHECDMNDKIHDKTHKMILKDNTG